MDRPPETKPANLSVAPASCRRRERLLRRMERKLELPLIVAGLIWLALLVAELLGARATWLSWVSNLIWVLFVADFVTRLALAPRRMTFLRHNVVTVVSLLLPALRIFRITRVLRSLAAMRAIRSVRLLRMVTGLNRGLRALRRVLARRRFGYVMAATALVTVSGAAGMYAFEGETGLFDSYAEALWWTAMLMTTMGSEGWPTTVEGRCLCLLLALWAFAMFGYITATLATFFVGRDKDAMTPGENAEIARLATEVSRLREALSARTGR